MTATAECGGCCRTLRSSARYGLDTRGPVLSYQKIIADLPQLHPEGRNALLIGLGGGYIAMAFAAQGIDTDALELDSEVAKAAQQYFLYEPSAHC